jgi:hypothetical protein
MKSDELGPEPLPGGEHGWEPRDPPLHTLLLVRAVLLREDGKDGLY